MRAGKSHVFAIVRTGVVSPLLNRLLYWSGTSWSTVGSVAENGDMTTVSAIPGLTLIAGSTGFAGFGTVPTALRSNR